MGRFPRVDAGRGRLALRHAAFGGANDDNIAFYGLNPFNQSGDGTLFKVSTNGAFTSLLSFDESFPDGYYPVGSLVRGANNSFYGVAVGGGANGRGAVYSFHAGEPLTNLAWFTKDSGSYRGNLQSFYQSYYGPPALLVSGTDCSFYGITTDDGANGSGTVYKLMAPSASAFAIQSVNLAGTNLVFTGLNGVAGATCHVLVSSNLNTPLGRWTAVTTNVLSASGNFSIVLTNAVTHGTGARYFILQSQ